MPNKPKKPCGYPGCPKLTNGQYCEDHKRLRDKEYNQYERDDFSATFYKTAVWRTIRRRHLYNHPFCEECLKNGKRTAAVIVDHIIPIKQGGAKYSENNLQSLCQSCHSSKSVREGSRFGKKK